VIHEAGAASCSVLLGDRIAESDRFRSPYRFRLPLHPEGPMTPRKKELSHVSHVRLPHVEHEEFVAASKRLGESRSLLLRRAVRDIIARPANLTEPELTAFVEAVHQLTAVGRNLNQLVRAVHVGKVTLVEGAPLDAVLAVLVSLDARMIEVVEKCRLRQVRR